MLSGVGYFIAGVVFLGLAGIIFAFAWGIREELKDPKVPWGMKLIGILFIGTLIYTLGKGILDG